MSTKPQTGFDETADTDSQPPVFRENDDLREATERAAEYFDTPTVARVVGRLSTTVGSDYRMETYVDAAKTVLGDDAPVTAAEAALDERGDDDKGGSQSEF